MMHHQMAEEEDNGEEYYVNCLLTACVRSHVFHNFQCTTTDSAVLGGIIKVITEKTVYEVISQKTRRKMEYRIGAPFVVKPFVEENSGTLKAITAQGCRHRHKAYACSIYVPWSEREYTWSETSSGGGAWVAKDAISRHVTSIQIPISVGSYCCHSADGHHAALSTECPYDTGGYFIVKGTEKVIVCPIIMQNNVPHIRCLDKDSGHWILEYRSLSDRKKRSTSTLVIHLHAKRGTSTPTLKVTVPFIVAPVPITLAFRLLGLGPGIGPVLNEILGEAQQQRLSTEALQLLTVCLVDEYIDATMDTAVQFLVKHSSSAAMGAREEDEVDVISNLLADGGGGAGGRIFSGCLTDAETNVLKATAAIAKARGRTVYNNFTGEFLPNMGPPSHPEYLQRKQRMFGHLIFLLMRAFDEETYQQQRRQQHSGGGSGSGSGGGVVNITDRDDCRFKRVEHPGNEIAYLWRRAWRLYMKSVLGASHNSMETNKRRCLPEITKTNTLASILNYAFATGNWGTEKAGSQHTGVTQQRATLNYSASMSHIDRVVSQINRESKDPKPRMLDTSQWGVFCPVETQENEGCGQTHNLTIQTRIRQGILTEHVHAMIIAGRSHQDYVPMTKCSVDELRDSPKLFINGALEGILLDVKKTFSRLRQLRRMSALPCDTSISLESGNISVSIDPGASTRPVLVVAKLDKLPAMMRRCVRYPYLLMNMLITAGILQYMDKAEENTARVAHSAEQFKSHGTDAFTHIEVHPALLLGVCASLIPFPDHNQAPRNIHGSCMNKQSASVSTLVADQRQDTVSLRLWYPQRPLVATAPSVACGANDLPSGQNAIVAVIPYAGHNQEDAVEHSKSSLDFGIFRTFYERTHRERDGGSIANRSKFMHIDNEERSYDALGNPVVNIKDTNFSSLGADGLVDPGTHIAKGACIVGKREVNASDGTSKDLSITYKDREKAQVSSVYFVSGETSGKKNVIIKTSVKRRPRIGDKFSSRHGQKGVCGDIISREDLPFTAGGITPDIMINPHGQPSRMTFGQMLEGILAKLQTIVPTSRRTTQCDGTAFQNSMRCVDGDDFMEQLNDQFLELGFMKLGHEMLYSGVTGLPMSSAVLYQLPPAPDAASAGAAEELSAFPGDNGTCITPLYYQCLRHVSKEKLGVRQTGPYDPITMQPIEGRMRVGGLKFGEMEKDVVAGIGCAEVLRGRLFKDSDAFPVVYCLKCHREGHFVPERQEESFSSLDASSAQQQPRYARKQMYCRACRSYETCIQTYIPKGMHCAFHESTAMMVGWRIHCVDHSANPYKNTTE